MKCEACGGKGTTPAFLDGPSGGRFDPAFRCSTCRGSGAITEEHAELIRRGRACRNYRVNVMGLSLREAATQLGASVVEVSAMEQGRADPWPLENAWCLYVPEQSP